MNPEQIEVIGLQPLEAGFDGLNHALATISSAVRVVRPHVSRVFSRNDETVPFSSGGDEFAKVRFACSAGIVAGGINKIRPCFYKRVEQFPADSLVRHAVPVLFTECHCTES
jgi:hypothetical protein